MGKMQQLFPLSWAIQEMGIGSYRACGEHLDQGQKDGDGYPL